MESRSFIREVAALGTAACFTLFMEGIISPGDWKWLAMCVVFLSVWWLLRPRYDWFEDQRINHAVKGITYVIKTIGMILTVLLVIVWILSRLTE